MVESYEGDTEPSECRHMTGSKSREENRGKNEQDVSCSSLVDYDVQGCRNQLLSVSFTNQP